MIRVSPDKKDAAAARNKIFEIHDQLASGADWNWLCSQFSEDLRTKNSGGELPYFGIGQIDQEFADAAFSLDSAGQISDPFRQGMAGISLRLIDKKPIDSFKDTEAGTGIKGSPGSTIKIGPASCVCKIETKI